MMAPSDKSRRLKIFDGYGFRIERQTIVQIHLENFRNIELLDYEIEDGKPNYLFGVCGSGKSSIVSAISRDAFAIDVTVGKDVSETRVTINGGEGILHDVRVYNAEEQNAIFRKSNNTGAYEVFVGDERELKALESQFNGLAANLRLARESLYSYQGRISELQAALGKLGKAGQFTKASKISKAAVVAQCSTPFVQQAIEKGGLDYANWLSSGTTITDDFNNGICPFCNHEISSSDAKKYEVLAELKMSDLKPFFSSSTLLEQFGVTRKMLETPEGENCAKERLKFLYKVSDELNKILRFVNMPESSLMEKGLPELEIEDCVYEEFPKLKDDIAALTAKSDEITKLLGRMKEAFNSLINKSCRQLNKQLDRLSIPYRFKVSSAARGDRVAEYSLQHIASPAGDDMRDLLSTGEKNLVALLLFLYRKDGETLLIDDPASSFDDYRRTQIFDMIQGVKGKTILVVSHDQAFVKRALLESGKGTIGKIQAISRESSGLVVRDIEKGDVVYLPDEIAHRIREAKTYRRKVINLRLLCDLRKEAVGDAWGYSSMILHGYSRDEVISELEKKSTSEKVVVDAVNETFGIDMPLMPINYPNEDQQLEELTDFEKLIELRERIDPNASEGNKLRVEMLNDLVHMNDAAAYCLNPYRFSTWSPALSELLA